MLKVNDIFFVRGEFQKQKWLKLILGLSLLMSHVCVSMLKVVFFINRCWVFLSFCSSEILCMVTLHAVSETEKEFLFVAVKCLRPQETETHHISYTILFLYFLFYTSYIYQNLITTKRYCKRTSQISNKTVCPPG